jgi:hypothetical protein
VAGAACGPDRRSRTGSGVPQDSGSDTDAGDLDSGNASGADATTGDASSTDASADVPIAPLTPPDASCDPAELNGHNYWFCTANQGWDAARALCMGVGGDLVSINDAPEQAFIEQHAALGNWLIGLDQKNASGASTVGEWEMVDGSALTAYDNWGVLQPGNSDCGVLGGNGRWSSIACNNAENWICEIP